MKRIVAPCALNMAAVQPRAAKSTIVHVDADKAATMIAEQSDIIVLDVRTPDEYSEGSIKGAINIDFFDDEFEAQLAELDRSAAYLIHCRSGGRSVNSLPILAELGFQNIVHLDGGFEDWDKAGQAVSR